MKKTKLIIPTIIALGAGFAASGAYADTTDFSITVKPSVSLSLSSASVNLQITPTQSGVYDSTSFTATASTNNTTGYTLVMTTNSTALVSDTVNVNTNVAPTIPSIAESQEGISAADFAASTDSNILNHWGLAIGNNNFNAIKASQTIKTTDTNVSNDTTTISMASKLNLLTAPGVYSTTLNFQLTANPLPDTLDTAYGKANKTKATINGRQYYAMQDMSTAICEDVDVINDQLQVYDTRDNTIYTIGKLADERCWLLDNLALDVASPTVQANLSPSNTNATQAAITNYINGGNVGNNDGWSTQAVSYELVLNGTYTTEYFTQPLINTDNKNTTRETIVNPDDIDPLEAANDWKFGIYYNYCAASVGTYCYTQGSPYSGGGIDRDLYSAIDAEQDICPANWRMPTGGEISSTGTSAGGGEYQHLFEVITGVSYEDYANLVIATDPIYREKIRTALHLPLPGTYFYREHELSAVGGWISVLSSTYAGEHNMNVLMIDDYDYISDFIDAWGIEARAMGQSVRCIAK